MIKLKKIGALALCAALTISVSACSMAFVNEERDMNQVVAEVNGTQLLKSEFLTTADSYAVSSYGTTYSTMIQGADKATIEAYNKSILESMINSELLYQEALKEGLVDNSEEGRKAVEEEINAEIEEQRQSYVEMAETNEYEDPEAYADEMMETYIKGYGYDDMEQAINDRIKNEGITAMQDKLNAEVSYTEEEAKEMYDLQVESHVESIKENPQMFQMYQSMGGQYFARPEGARFVKHILISLPDEAQSEITKLRNSGDEAGADALRDEELAKIQANADAALARVNAGEDFDALMEELGEDPGMKAEPAKTEGYLVYEGSGMVAEFEEAALAMQNEGDVTDLVPTDYGYHIIKYIKDGGGQIPFEEVKEDMVESGLKLEQQSHTQEYLKTLKENSSIKTYENRLALNS